MGGVLIGPYPGEVGHTQFAERLVELLRIVVAFRWLASQAAPEDAGESRANVRRDVGDLVCGCVEYRIAIVAKVRVSSVVMREAARECVEQRGAEAVDL